MTHGTEHFKQTIKSYLDGRAQADTLFGARYGNPKKNIDDCCTYIMNQVQRSGCNGFTDDEIYSMAVHYYDEEDIDVGKPINCRVVVNHTVELTDEEKEQARRDAMQRAQEEAYRQMTQPKRNRTTKKAEQTPNVQQKSLFE